jgi:hypothetical protein
LVLKIKLSELALSPIISAPEVEVVQMREELLDAITGANKVSQRNGAAGM